VPERTRRLNRLLQKVSVGSEMLDQLVLRHQSHPKPARSKPFERCSDFE
jgi:hypothetical protein